MVPEPMLPPSQAPSPVQPSVSFSRSSRACLFACLLYTSDAADERSSVDLGGRRIIKKKKTRGRAGMTADDTYKLRQEDT